MDSDRRFYPMALPLLATVARERGDRTDSGQAARALALSIKLWLRDGQCASDHMLRIPANPEPGQ